MNAGAVLELTNCGRAPVADIPVLDAATFREEVLQRVEAGERISSFFACTAMGAEHRLIAVLCGDSVGRLGLLSTLATDSFESLTPECPQAHLFEREIFEQHGIRPAGHPWLKPVRFPGVAVRDGGPVIGDADFFRIHGDEIHEVAVGPVHAGVIEPGHFRFQCHGETVHHLEISLGYQHRGIEQALIGGPHPLTMRQIETTAGDTSVGHAIAYCQAMEALTGCPIPTSAQFIRGIALELERCANHTGDLGALAGDVGYLPTLSFCGRLRGDFLNMTALICGNRFGRGLIVPGGTGYDLDPARAEKMREHLRAVRRDFLTATSLVWTEPSVLARFENTGIVSQKDCLELGLVGPVARACGCNRDIRQDHPEGVYRFFHIPVVTDFSGDVRSRAYIRWREVQQSMDFIEEQLASAAGGAITVPMGELPPDSIIVSLVEGWRGEICHTVMTDHQGRLAQYKIVDPSFHNWMGLALSLRGEQISDFPLCNKSFNLSYCGHDL